MKEKILLVDDEEGIRKVLGISLEDSGYKVLTAENGDEALRIFREEAPEIVLTDIKMPGMDGIEVLRKIKHENPDTEVIVITGHGDMDLAVKSLKYEAADFITKPVDDESLERALRKSHERILNRRHLKKYTENLEGLVHKKSEMLASVTQDQEASQVASQKYQHLFDETPCYMAAIDKEFRLTAMNRMIKNDFGDEINQLCYQVFRQKNTSCEACPVEKTFEDGASHRAEMLFRIKDGTSRNMVIWTSPLRDDGGDITHSTVMFTDISQVIELQDHLASLGLMIGSVSHGIKGLLTGLDGGVYMLSSGISKDKPERISDGLDIVKQTVAKIKRMVLDILYSTKERELNKEEIGIAEFAADLANVVETKMNEHQIEFVKETDPSAGVFEADKDQLGAALINILENAVDACAEDSSKSEHQIVFGVKLSEDNASVLFQISDNGIGMNEETRKKLFTLFFSSKATKGTGMGLFVSNKVVCQHGGEITVDSVPGEGTRFCVKIPKKT